MGILIVFIALVLLVKWRRPDLESAALLVCVVCGVCDIMFGWPRHLSWVVFSVLPIVVMLGLAYARPNATIYTR